MGATDQQQQKTLRFDFNEAVAEARRDFPAETKGITFIDLDAPDAAEKMQKFYDGLSDTAKREANNRRAEDADFLTAKARPAVWRTTDGQGVMLAYGSRSLMNDIEKVALNGLDPEKNRHYTFWHEAGHIIVPGGQYNSNHGEHAADSFAVLKGLQSGFLDKQDVKKIADGRDMICWFNHDVTHVTSMSLDALIINPKHTDFISLSPQETAALAAKHAQTFSLNAELSSYYRVADALPRWGNTLDEMRQNGLDNLGDIVMKADRTTLAFYVAARVLLTAKEKKDAGDPLLEKIELGGGKWDKAFETLAKKSQGRDIGAAKAATAEDKPQNALQKLHNRLKPLSI